jgi:hypothetical protein
MNYGTYTQTYTIVDIRKAFENFEADLRMIARRTAKWSDAYVDQISHDVIKMAEAKYLLSISIVMKDTLGKDVKAAKFTVNQNGSGITGDRAGGNDWANLPNTSLTVILEYSDAWRNLSIAQKQAFQTANDFKIGWVPASTDINFPSLQRETAQTYSSNGYEVKKENFK